MSILDVTLVRLKTNLLKYKLTIEKTMFESHVNLFSFIIIIMTIMLQSGTIKK